MKNKTIAIALVAVGALTGSRSEAAIVGTTGAIQNNGQLTSGTILELGGTQSGTQIRAYHESSVTLSSALAVDAVGPLFIAAGSIANGTQLDSYLLHFDPVVNPVTRIGSITFDTPILGVIFNTASLNATDSLLGVAGVTYSVENARGIELPAPDSWSVSGGTLRFNADFTVNTILDEVRILTAVPEPSTYLAGAMLALVFGVQGFRSLRRHKQAA